MFNVEVFRGVRGWVKANTFALILGEAEAFADELRRAGQRSRIVPCEVRS